MHKFYSNISTLNGMIADISNKVSVTIRTAKSEVMVEFSSVTTTLKKYGIIFFYIIAFGVPIHTVISYRLLGSTTYVWSLVTTASYQGGFSVGSGPNNDGHLYLTFQGNAQDNLLKNQSTHVLRF